MRIVVEAFWDGEAEVWVASSQGDPGLVTEAETLDALRERIVVILPDLLDLANGTQAEFDLVVHTGTGVVAAA